MQYTYNILHNIYYTRPPRLDPVGQLPVGGDCHPIVRVEEPQRCLVRALLACSFVFVGGRQTDDKCTNPARKKKQTKQTRKHKTIKQMKHMKNEKHQKIKHT